MRKRERGEQSCDAKRADEEREREAIMTGRGLCEVRREAEMLADNGKVRRV